MGGAVQKVGQAIGVDKKPSAPAQIVERPKIRQVNAGEEMMGARMRGARRRGRQLLSDVRLSESGAETLGGGQSLG